MTARGSGTKTPRGYQFEPFAGPATFQAAALARKGDLELRLRKARESFERAKPVGYGLRDTGSMERLIGLYVDMIAVIDGHLAKK